MIMRFVHGDDGILEFDDCILKKMRLLQYVAWSVCDTFALVRFWHACSLASARVCPLRMYTESRGTFEVLL